MTPPFGCGGRLISPAARVSSNAAASSMGRRSRRRRWRLGRRHPTACSRRLDRGPRGPFGPHRVLRPTARQCSARPSTGMTTTACPALSFAIRWSTWSRSTTTSRPCCRRLWCPSRRALARRRAPRPQPSRCARLRRCRHGRRTHRRRRCLPLLPLPPPPPRAGPVDGLRHRRAVTRRRHVDERCRCRPSSPTLSARHLGPIRGWCGPTRL